MTRQRPLQASLLLGKALGMGRRPRREPTPLERQAKNDLAKARRRLARHADLGIELESMGEGQYNVWPPRGLAEADDPADGDHWCCSGTEVLALVEQYIRIMTQEGPPS